MRHVLLLVVIASQGSTPVAVQYERTLVQHIRNLKGAPDINVFLCDKVPAVETAVNIHFSQFARKWDHPPITKTAPKGGFLNERTEAGAPSVGRGEYRRGARPEAQTWRKGTKQ